MDLQNEHPYNDLNIPFFNQMTLYTVRINACHYLDVYNANSYILPIIFESPLAFDNFDIFQYPFYQVL